MTTFDEMLQDLVNEDYQSLVNIASNAARELIPVLKQYDSENDGALLLLYHTPEEIIEGSLNGHKTIKFHATQHFEANDYAPEHTLHYNYFILFNETEGYAVVITGEADMEVMERIAENLEIVVTDEIIKSSDFENNAAFLDGGVG